MITDYLLIIISLIWVLAASISDIKTKEVPDWLSYSLILIALTIKGIHSIVFKDLNFFFLGLLGLAIALALGSMMYYTKQWGGGDAKLLMGLSIIYIEYPKSLLNYFTPSLDIPFLLILILNLIIVGTLYSLIWTIYLFLKNKNQCNKKLKELTKETKKLRNLSLISAAAIAILSIFLMPVFATIPLIIAPILFYYLLLFIKTVEKTTFLKTISTKNLTEGDWITKDIVIDNKTIYKKSSPGVNKKQIEIIKKHLKEVPVKEGIPFVPPFLFAIIVSLIYGNLLTFIL
tara:strand:+ start:6316 stop:7179 length:864 start_codon:yes stop_codon:yes gene_type:complete